MALTAVTLTVKLCLCFFPEGLFYWITEISAANATEGI